MIGCYPLGYSSLRASGIARRRAEEERAETLPSASDDEVGGFQSAMREQRTLRR
jgi:hypothetical protein